jgi:PemK-like, MazF-like toxin of type II toxin-antitoxin system
VGAFAVGTVVLVPFPFSDLSASKLRPAIILADAGRGDWICAQITSNPYSDGNAVSLAEADFSTGSLAQTSYVRPGKLFTANESLFRRAAATLDDAALQRVLTAVIALFAR